MLKVQSTLHVVTIMPLWKNRHRVFAYYTFVKSDESIVETQQCFRRDYRIDRHGKYPSWNAVLRWVNSFRTKG